MIQYTHAPGSYASGIGSNSIPCRCGAVIGIFTFHTVYAGSTFAPNPPINLKMVNARAVDKKVVSQDASEVDCPKCLEILASEVEKQLEEEEVDFVDLMGDLPFA